MAEGHIEVGSLGCDGLKRRLDLGEPLAVLDVREDDERAYCAIDVPGPARDLHIPMSLLQGRFADVAEAAGGRPLVVYCHHGVRSLAVAHWLAAQGLKDVHNLEGGIDAWSTQVDRSVRRY